MIFGHVICIDWLLLVAVLSALMGLWYQVRRKKMKKKKFVVLLLGLLWLAGAVVVNYVPAVASFYRNVAYDTRYLTDMSLLAWYKFAFLCILDAIRYGHKQALVVIAIGIGLLFH